MARKLRLTNVATIKLGYLDGVPALQIHPNVDSMVYDECRFLLHTRGEKITLVVGGEAGVFLDAVHKRYFTPKQDLNDDEINHLKVKNV